MNEKREPMVAEVDTLKKDSTDYHFKYKQRPAKRVDSSEEPVKWWQSS